MNAGNSICYHMNLNSWPPENNSMCWGRPHHDSIKPNHDLRFETLGSANHFPVCHDIPLISVCESFQLRFPVESLVQNTKILHLMAEFQMQSFHKLWPKSIRCLVKGITIEFRGFTLNQLDHTTESPYLKLLSVYTSITVDANYHCHRYCWVSSTIQFQKSGAITLLRAHSSGLRVLLWHNSEELTKCSLSIAEFHPQVKSSIPSLLTESLVTEVRVLSKAPSMSRKPAKPNTLSSRA